MSGDMNDNGSSGAFSCGSSQHSGTSNLLQKMREAEELDVKRKKHLKEQLDFFLKEEVSMCWIQASMNYVVFLLSTELFGQKESHDIASSIVKRLKEMRGGVLTSEDVYRLEQFAPKLLEEEK